MAERMNLSGTGVELNGMFTLEQLEQIILRMKFRQQQRKEEYKPEYPVYKSNKRSPYEPRFGQAPAWMESDFCPVCGDAPHDFDCR